MKTKDLTIQALIAGVYIALSLMFMPLTFGTIQVRIAELTLLLMLIHPKNSIGIIVGCFITNLFSVLGLPDVIFGTAATALTCFLMAKTDNDILCLLWPALINGLIVGAELTILFKVFPFYLNAFSVAIGEVIAVFIPGLLMRHRLRKSSKLREFFG